jgi:UDP-N-acetylmuramate--alanine ligase
LRTYEEYLSHLDKGILIINGEDKNIKKLVSNFKHLSMFDFQSSNLKENKKLKTILSVPGEHNISNALIALTIARILKISDKVSYKALSTYKGAWRRFEESKLKIGDFKLKIISDYAHHPTEIKVTLKAIREKFPQKEIWCVFQPHQYQRTFYLFKDFVKTFKQAIDKSKINKIIITDIYDVAGREKKNIKNKINSEKLIKEINNPLAIYLPKDKIRNYIKKNTKGKEIIIIMGAGDIYRVLNN